jgi:cbb3-type cytochrome oxidase subunit 3
MEKEKPFWVIMISLVLIAYSVFNLFRLVLLIKVHGLPTPPFPYPGIKFIWMIIILASGICLLKLLEWARILILFLLSTKILFGLIGVVRVFGSKEYDASLRLQYSLQTAIFLIVSLSMLYYLTRPKVKEQFK